MRDISILHETLKKHCPNVHQKRLSSLIVAARSLLDGQGLSLTELGRHISGPVSAKHNIKRIDRLLGNRSLHAERVFIYQWHARYLCGANPMPIVLVDWSDVREQSRLMTLRASVSVKGRSVILYERVFAFAQYNSPVSHQVFLDELSEILPVRCCPLIVTDAGYRNPWFRAVEAKGWYWLGRIRGEVGFKRRGSQQWISNKIYYAQASHKAVSLGEGELGRKRPIDAYLHLYKAKAKGRKDKRSTRSSARHNTAQDYRAGSKEPWLLATNMPGNLMTSAQIVSMYAKRMCPLPR